MEGSRPVLVKHVAPTFYGRYFNVTDRFLTPSSMPNVWPSRKVNRLPIFRPYKEPPSALCTAHWGVPPYHGLSRGGPIFLRHLFFCWWIGFLLDPACHGRSIDYPYSSTLKRIPHGTALCTEGPHPNMVNHMVPIFLRPLFFVLADRFLTPSSMPNAWPSREVNRLPLNERCVRDLSPWNVVLVTLAIWLKSMVRWVSYKDKGIYKNHFTKIVKC